MRVLLHYYGVELHNFNPNSIARVVESQPKRWRYGVPLADQSKLQPLLRALERLRSRSLTAAIVVEAFHHQRVLPLMARRQRLFKMTPGELIDGIRLSAVALSDEEILRRGMRDVRASPPPVPEDALQRAENRAHAEAYKEQKDAEEARHKRKSLERDELEKCRRQHRHDGLPKEPSPSSSSMNSSSDDDESKAGRGPLDHLPNIREMAPRASASGLASLGGGGEGALGLVIAHPGAEADTPETWASGKRAVSPMGSTVEVERATMGQPNHLRRGPRGRWSLARASRRKHQAEAPALAPLKALKVSTSSTARWVVDAQAAMQHGAASARADSKGPIAQGEAIEAATKEAGEEVPMPHEIRALELGEAETSSITEATEGEAEAPRTSKAEVAKARASRAFEAEVVDVGAPRTTKAEVAEAGAPGTTEAEVAEVSLGTVELAA
ncbi:uncharacterized protein [Miscanthus floridulus]|uniref:uncharacterized protein n=1 Tax=Miscanthus floridulus TaxID=154761 RepID=UPI0034578074